MICTPDGQAACWEGSPDTRTIAECAACLPAQLSPSVIITDCSQVPGLLGTP
jgi:hypothetical protein